MTNDQVMVSLDQMRRDFEALQGRVASNWFTVQQQLAQQRQELAQQQQQLLRTWRREMEGTR